MKVITHNFTDRIVKEILIQTWRPESIAYAERQKTRLENSGYTLVRESAGIDTASLIYKKAI